MNSVAGLVSIHVYKSSSQVKILLTIPHKTPAAQRQIHNNMTFQQLVTLLVLLSIVSTCLLVRLTSRSILSPLTPLVFALLLVTQLSLAIAFNILVWPLISPLRSLPCAPQKHPLRRLLKEPCPWHFEAWVNSVPNEGLIRYYGILNVERVLVTSPEVVKTVLQTQVYSFNKQYHQKSYFEKVQGYGLVIQEGNFHKHARKLIGHALGQKRVNADYWPIIQRKVSQMLEVVARAAEAKQSSEKQDVERPAGQAVLAIDKLMQRTVFDVSGEVSYGIDFESVLEPEKHYAAMKSYNEAFEGNSATRLRLLLGFVLPKWVVDVLPIKFNWTATAGMRHFKQIGRAYMTRTTPDIAEAQPVKSVMDELIAGKQMDDRELWEQYLMMLPGALHNTLSGMMSAIWFLGQSRYAHVQRRLRQELQENLGSLDDSEVTQATFEKCVYLKAVINEVLRVHAPASWFGRAVDTPTEICGVLLPRGLSVGLSPWAFHRNKSMWGEDAAEFKPERWLAVDKPMNTTAENQAWLTFGAGPRRCVGEALAKAELYCVLARLFRNFQVELVDSDQPPKISHHITVAYREALRVHVSGLEVN